jgi:hypothetical protein
MGSRKTRGPDFLWRFMGDVCGNLWNIDEDIEMIYHEIA